MRAFLLPLLILVFSIPQAAQSVSRYNNNNYGETGVALRLADPTGSVYRQNEEVRFAIETQSDAYVLLFDIDTDGFVNLLYPREGQLVRKFFAGRSYEIPEDPSESLLVMGKPGMEFVFAVAVPNRDAISERQISFLHDDAVQPPERRFRIDGDPFLAANRIAEQLVRGIKYSDEISLAYTYFYVDRAVDYPRYMCEDCYRTGRDPYDSDAPTWVATAAFDREAELVYPLQAAFTVRYSDNLARPLGYDGDADDAYEYETDNSTTHVYVSYYPRWVGVPWHYPSWGFGGWYGAGFYFGVGWSWGVHSPWRYCRSPIYYPYYHDRGSHYVGGDLYDNRTLRHENRYRYKGSNTLHTAMVQTADAQRTLRAKTVRTANSSPSVKSTYRPRAVKTASRQPTSGLARIQRPDEFRSGKVKRGYDKGTREIYSPRANSIKNNKVRVPSRSAASRGVRTSRRQVDKRTFDRRTTSKSFKNRSSKARTHRIRGSSSKTGAPSRSRATTGSRSNSRSKGGSSRKR